MLIATRLIAVALFTTALLPAAQPPLLRPIRLGLLVDTDAPLPPAVRLAFQEETARLFDVPWLDLHWGDTAHPRLSEPFDRVIIIRLCGTCSPHTTFPERPEPGALGLTHVSDGHILPFVEADCRRLVAASSRLRALPFRLGSQNLGRAIARVVAHEIYHVLSGSSRHDAQGLTKASLSPAELFLPGLDFDPAALDRIAAAVTAPGLLATLAPPTPQAP